MKLSTTKESRRDFLKLSAGGLTTLGLNGMNFAQASSFYTSEITWMPDWQLVSAMSTKRISPVEVIEYFLQRIERLDKDIHAYITVDWEGH
jgi:hypothetical protein|tara:strand:- start:858 stop:1130 length:273 start_codon:yes stop_codon:yes gene_type:complete